MKKDVIKIRMNIQDRAFAYFVLTFFLIMLIFYIKIGNIPGILASSALTLIGIILLMVVTHTLVLKDNKLLFTWATFIKYTLELKDISKIVNKNENGYHFIEIFNKEGSKSIQLNLKLKYADELLNRIQQYEREHSMNIIWIEK